MPPIFFDTDALIRTKVDVKYLTLESIDSAWEFLDNSPVSISRNELGNYILSFGDDYEYKYALVALKQKQVVGIALFSDLDTEVLLNHLYVLPTARFQGIGTKLMTQLQRYAGKREISKIDISSSYTQYPSKGMVLGFDILRVWKDEALTITSYDSHLISPYAKNLFA